jgi:hypothetical protein
MKPEKGNGCSGNQKCRDDEAAKEHSQTDTMPKSCDSAPSASLPLSFMIVKGFWTKIQLHY